MNTDGWFCLFTMMIGMTVTDAWFIQKRCKRGQAKEEDEARRRKIVDFAGNMSESLLHLLKNGRRQVHQ